MALTAGQIAQFYEIIGVPQAGTAAMIYTLSDPAGASADTFDHAAVVTLINTLLAALSSDQVTRVQTHLTRWTAIGASEPVVSRDRAGSVFADYAAERAAIRTALEALTGIYIRLTPAYYTRFTVVR